MYDQLSECAQKKVLDMMEGILLNESDEYQVEWLERVLETHGGHETLHCLIDESLEQLSDSETEE